MAYVDFVPIMFMMGTWNLMNEFEINIISEFNWEIYYEY